MLRRELTLGGPLGLRHLIVRGMHALTSNEYVGQCFGEGFNRSFWKVIQYIIATDPLGANDSDPRDGRVSFLLFPFLLDVWDSTCGFRGVTVVVIVVLSFLLFLVLRQEMAES